MATSPSSLQSLIWELRRSFRELSALADRGLEPLGIGTGDRALLEFLARESGPVSLAELARKHAVSRQHVHQALGRLPNSGWVETATDPADARVALVQLSPAGRTFWEKVRQREDRLLTRLGRNLDPDELQAALAFLQHLRRAVAAFEEP
jgi:DNA-binding MarR family transcriptional regulator